MRLNIFLLHPPATVTTILQEFVAEESKG